MVSIIRNASRYWSKWVVWWAALCGPSDIFYGLFVDATAKSPKNIANAMSTLQNRWGKVLLTLVSLLTNLPFGRAVIKRPTGFNLLASKMALMGHKCCGYAPNTLRKLCSAGLSPLCRVSYVILYNTTARVIRKTAAVIFV